MSIKKSILYIVSRILYGKYGSQEHQAIHTACRIYTKYKIQNTKYAARSAGFTFIETMVAISILTISIVAPMSLATKSLSSAYYARDQIAAFHLAQEAIESVRHVRDGNVLNNALGTSVNLLEGIPSTNGGAFTIDTRDDSMTLCPLDGCPPLKSNGELYGYDNSAGWVPTRFTRSIRAVFVNGTTDEIHVTVTVSWTTSGFQTRSFTISANLYRWVNDGSGSTI